MTASITGAATTAAPTALQTLEALLGNPWDETGPVSFAAILDADESAQPLAAAESLVDQFGLSRFYVPASLGGELRRMDELIALLRALCRRDPVLGFGHSLSSLMAAVNVWTVGEEHVCRRLAEALLDGERVACAYHELAHGNNLTGMALDARIDGSGWRLTGRKEVVTNIARSDMLVAYARTDSTSSSRGHSLFLLRRSTARNGSIRMLARFPAAGLRGVQLGGIEFFDTPVPAESLCGRTGQGLEAAVRSFQITRIVIPAMAVGSLDLALRVAVRYARGRRLYGNRVVDLELVRSQIAATFVDLQIADALVAVAARVLHLRPREASLIAAAVKLHVPQLLHAGTTQLSAILGAQFYLRDGENALMQKLVRDIGPTAFVHASALTCQQTILPQLPLVARRSWTSDGESAAAEQAADLFDLSGHLDDLDPTTLAVAHGGTDIILPGLDAWLGGPAATEIDGARKLRSQLRAFVAEAAALPPSALAGDMSAAHVRLVERYVVLLAAACALQTWSAAATHSETATPDWYRQCVVNRTLHRLGLRVGCDAALDDAVMGEIDRRYDDGLTFDLAAQRLPSTSTPPPTDRDR
ncbi:acyl-CoA dehydrogenase [Williamsia sp. CHRR-6]|uniref:acyl-CoA dehydrogenase n=1 Tax=Williamsia sp. CHRR-6 TaxID=2835871 RepID=UPI001BDB3CCD|nr:acyl-CoA dehydrogenase [Williamsia sp. CHRR-6]MBT0566975.1 acyl-CoA dehydrogenase [Williamsia sp. CHRR-6]